MSYVNKSLQKKDAMALVTGKPVYTDDLAPKDCLIIKSMYSSPGIHRMSAKPVRSIYGDRLNESGFLCYRMKKAISRIRGMAFSMCFLLWRQ